MEEEWVERRRSVVSRPNEEFSEMVFGLEAVSSYLNCKVWSSVQLSFQRCIPEALDDDAEEVGCDIASSL